MIGQRIGPYEVLAKVGAGGMGEVYRARDSKLNRDVAIKTLPALFATDGERVARLKREAQTLASLNHPNIAQIYGIEDAALVMELVEGEDLAAIIGRGPLPVGEALAIARQIADALEAAHDQGVVHRDLKPANVKVKADGRVKVLDFGLAKALDPSAASSVSGPASNSPTLTAAAFAPGGPGTQIGMILGTAAYMAPEQARGKPVDRRADVWAFGIVLYEMLTGRRAFHGEEISDVLAAVLRQDIDWSALPANTPVSVRRLLTRCLERDPRKRLSAIGDARLDIDDADASAPVVAAPAARPATGTGAGVTLAIMFIAGAAAAAIVAYLLRPSAAAGAAAEGALMRMSLQPPPGLSLYPDTTGVVISPDGSKVVFVVGSVAQATENELWVRSLDSMVSRKLDDTRRAGLPFWSPDSRRIGFYENATGKMKTTAASGGRSESLADVTQLRGAFWTPSNFIVYGRPSGPIMKVAAGGGTPEPVTTLDESKGEAGHRFPAPLPGDRFLYAVLPGKNGKFDVYAGSFTDVTNTSRVFIGAFDAAPTYAEPGYLLFARQGVLAAQPFDAQSLKVTGDPIPLEDEPASILDPTFSYTAARSVSLSTTGALAYYSTPSNRTIATWFDLSGAQVGNLNLPPAYYDRLAISPNGKRAIAVRSASASESSLWMVDLLRSTLQPLVRSAGRNDAPVWSPTGDRIVFASDRSGRQVFYIKYVDDARPEQEFYSSAELFKAPYDWSPDGSTISLNVFRTGSAQDIELLDASGKAPSRILVQTPVRDVIGTFSPDSKWLAYASEASGELQVWVQPVTGAGPKVQVSQSGGARVWWSPKGDRLLWISSDLRSVWSATVRTETGFTVGDPIKLGTLPAGIVHMDMTPDRTKMLAVTPERLGTGSATVVLNWRKALEGKR